MKPTLTLLALPFVSLAYGEALAREVQIELKIVEIDDADYDTLKAELEAGKVTLPAADLTDSVERYCIDCHNTDKAKGELDLESILDDKISAHAATWEAVARRLSAREMPPPPAGHP